MAALSYRTASFAGSNPNLVAASAGGDTVQPNPNGFLYVNNGSASAITVTIGVPGTDEYGRTRTALTVSVPATSARMIGPMAPSLYNSVTGAIDITYSAVTTVTVAPLSAS